MSEMVDRVAQAILDAINAPSEEPPSGVLGMDSGVVDCRKLAVAAIHSMREPTKAMVMVAGISGYVSAHQGCLLYRDMIGVALITP